MTIEPKVTISDSAVEAFRGVAGEAGDDVLRLSIDAKFINDLFFGPREPNDIVITANGVTLAMDANTARRANGLKIDYVEGPDAIGFKLDNPNQSPHIKGVRPAEVRQMLEKKERFEFIDVRRESERATARVDASRLLDEHYEAEILTMPNDTRLVFMCHHSSRAQSTAQLFYDRGFTNVWYVVGGIDAWSTMDPSVPRY